MSSQAHLRARPALACLLLAGTLLMGCTGEVDDPASRADPTAAADADVEPAEGDRGEAGVVEVDFEERSANGTTVRVTRFEITDLAILADVEIIVAAEQDTVYFNNPINGNEAQLIDDQGNTYDLIPPDDNQVLRMSAGERLEGALSFQGPLHRGARTIQLILNPTSRPDSSNPLHLLQPHFTFPAVEVAS
jgi:hypothetical protein